MSPCSLKIYPAYRAEGPEFESRWCQKLCVLEIPLDKELTANCLVETRTKLGELIRAAMVHMWADQGSAPLEVAAEPEMKLGVEWNLLNWATVVSEHL